MLSSASHGSQQSPRASTFGSPEAANATSQPKSSVNGNIEAENVRAKLPIEEDIMQLARLGETGSIQKLIASGRYDARYKDEEGITPLHVCHGPRLILYRPFF